MASPDIKNLIVYNSSNDISYIEYNRPGLPYKFDATYIYHSNENYNDGSYSSQLGTISNNLIIESATSNIILSTPANKKVIVKANMAVNASLDVSNIVTTYRLNVNDICLNNILYLNSSLTENVFGDLKINGSISQIAASNEEIAGFTSNNASLTTSTFAFGDISLSDIFTSNIYSSTITNSYISNTAIGYNSDNISFPTKAVFTDVSLVSLTLDTSVNGASYIKFNNNSNSANSTIIKSSDDYSKLDINKPLKIGFGTVSNISVFNGDISCNTLYYSQLNPDIKLNNYFDVSIGHISLSGNIIPTLNNTFSIGSSTNKFNTITSTLFIGNLFGACTLANDLVKNLDMSFNNLDISGTIRLGGIDLNQTLQSSYLTISGANVSFNAVNSRINELSANVYSRDLIDICLNTNYIRNRVFDLSFQDTSGRIVDLSRNVYSRAFIDLCLNTNFVRVNNSPVTQFRIFDNRFIFESSGNYIQQIATGYNNTIISEWRTNWLSSNNPVLRFHSDGSITNLTNSYATWSDIRLKENIVNTSPKLQDLLKVRVVNYNLKGTSNENSNKHIGVIAQELEQLFPELIGSHELTQEDINAGITESYKSVKYSCFSVILIKALQEEHEIINKLNARIETLNEDCNSIKDLEERTNLMSASINILKEENVILKYKLDEILTKLGKSVIV
jgi:CII-binding regulator of phage lambda lysogenization HflD